MQTLSQKHQKTRSQELSRLSLALVLCLTFKHITKIQQELQNLMYSFQSEEINIVNGTMYISNCKHFINT